MKRHLFLIITVLFLNYVYAQNAIPNAGFENWTSQGSYDNCTGWGTIDQSVATFCFCAGTAVKTAVAGEVHGGTLAMKLKTISVFGQTAPGIAATGTINTTTQVVDGGVAYNLQPDSIVGWYRYTPSGTDTGSVEITLSKWNSGTNTRDVVATAKFTQNASVASYVRFSQALTYSLTSAPDTMVIVLLSSSPAAPQVNSTMWVDDLDLIFNNTTNIANNHLVNSLVSIYPNPSNGNFVVETNSTEKQTIQLFDINGKLVLNQTINGKTNIDVSNLAEGVYNLSLINSEWFVVNKRVVILH
jgi:type IX secretion system substrate protein